MKAIYPGSFDPFTNGHLDILKRSLAIYSNITIVIAEKQNKIPLLTMQERLEVIQKIISRLPNVSVEVWSGLMMDYVKKKNIQVIIRGLRATSDFEYEFMMASMNRQINSSVETIFMMTSHNLYFISSSIIKELFHYGGNISPYVPKEVLKKLKQMKKNK